MENNNQKKNDGKFPGGSTWGVLAILMLVTFLAVSFMNDYWKKSKSEALSYTEFIEMLDNGEIDEGTVWEAAMSAAKFKLDHLIAVIDRNRVQLDGTTDNIMPTDPLDQKWAAFGWNVITCDGHDIAALDQAFTQAKANTGCPTVIIAETVKGKGVSFMEGKNSWHGAVISDESLALALAELGGT